MDGRYLPTYIGTKYFAVLPGHAACTVGTEKEVKGRVGIPPCRHSWLGLVVLGVERWKLPATLPAWVPSTYMARAAPELSKQPLSLPPTARRRGGPPPGGGISAAFSPSSLAHACRLLVSFSLVTSLHRPNLHTPALRSPSQSLPLHHCDPATLSLVSTSFSPRCNAGQTTQGNATQRNDSKLFPPGLRPNHAIPGRTGQGWASMIPPSHDDPD